MQLALALLAVRVN